MSNKNLGMAVEINFSQFIYRFGALKFRILAFQGLKTAVTK
jgi:hypothetical protein